MKAAHLRAGPRDVVRWILAALLAAMAVGVGAILVVVGAGKVGFELMPTFEMRLFVSTTAWTSLPLWALTAGGFGAAAVLLVRRSRRAFWAWLAGYAGAVVTQVLETTTANAVGAQTDASGPATLALLALVGWGVYVLTLRKPRGLPRR